MSTYPFHDFTDPSAVVKRGVPTDDVNSDYPADAATILLGSNREQAYDEVDELHAELLGLMTNHLTPEFLYTTNILFAGAVAILAGTADTAQTIMFDRIAADTGRTATQQANSMNGLRTQIHTLIGMITGFRFKWRTAIKNATDVTDLDTVVVQFRADKVALENEFANL